MTSETAAEPKALEILESVKAMFASKGFDGASMQDLARAADMSAGNFYRYFPSKNAIIEAMIERELDQVRGEFSNVVQSPDPLAAFRGMVRQRVETGGDCESQIWVEMEAAAARRPEVAALFVRMETEITRALVAVFARIADLPQDEAEQRFSAHARLIVMLVQGVSTRCASLAGSPKPPPDRQLAALVVRVIEHTLSEVAAPGASWTAEPDVS